jgi:tetratricopeptide (TPR) repeat protein
MHTRLRALVYERAGHVRRRLLHRRVAAALERRERRGEQQSAAVVAAHHAAGGDGPAAAVWFGRAAAYAARLLAVPEAVEQYERALAHGHPDPAHIHEALGDLQMLSGSSCGALRSYDAAAALVDGEPRAVLEHKIAGVYQPWGRSTLADEHLRMALAALDEGDAATPRALRARILTDRGLVAYRGGHADEARSLAEAALREALDAGDPGAQAGAHNLLGVVGRDDLSFARDHLERALGLARDHHDVRVEVAAANNLAQAHATAGALDRALPLAESALARVGQLADHHREAALRNNLADLLRAAGRHEEAMLHLKRAVALFAEIGEPHERAPEIWSLAVW